VRLSLIEPSLRSKGDGEDGDASSMILANGLRVIEMPMPGRLATAIEIAFPGGARYERPQEIGAAHFLEHMAFKGAEKHPTARSLHRSAERLGADLNGTTTNDYVEFSTVVRAESTMPAIDLLTDITGQALLEEDLVEGERAVILQEIADDGEVPANVADRLILKALFRGHRLATSTIGEAPHVSRLTHAQLLEFRERQWSPEGGVVVIAGNLSHLDRKLVAELLLRVPKRPAPPSPSPTPQFVRRVEVEERESDVARLHLAYAVSGLDLTRARDRAVSELYSGILGGLTGSRLFEEVREKRSLSYEIDGYVWGYRDASLLSVECGLQASDVPEAFERIDEIVTGLAREGPTEEEWLRARTYTTAATVLGYEAPEACVDHAVELTMEYDDHDVDPVLELRAIESVTREEIAELAARVAPGPCVACVGAVSRNTFQ
jgi:predicted Zn-dependent peptidase